MSKTWAYKATIAKLDKAGTQLIARKGFLCRSLFTTAGARVANVGSVCLGDTIHFYYSQTGQLFQLGAFVVIDAAEHPHPEWFGGRVDDSALFEVNDRSFISTIDTEGAYQPDPHLKQILGWCIRRIGNAPPASPKFKAEMATLVEVKAEA